MMSDLRYAWRSLRKSPAITAGAVLALALGVGATTTVFSLLNAVLLRPLPFPESERLVEIWGTVQRQEVERRGASYPDLYDWRNRSTSFDGMASWSPSTAILYGAGEPEPVAGEIVDGPYLDLLGVRPIAGRTLGPSDHRPDAHAVAVIGERLWERRFGRRADIVGQSLQFDIRLYEVVGVVPASFRGRSDASEVFVNASGALSPAAMAARGNRSFAVLARLAPGVTREAAQAELDGINAQLAAAYPRTNEARAAEVSPLADEVFGAVRPAVSLLFGAVAMVLLVACANVASLLLGRSEARRREFTLRRALGADRGRLIRLLLAESAWLVVLGSAAGALFSLWTADALVAISPVQLPSFAAPGIDWRLLAFASALAVTTTVLIGLSPMASLGGSLADGLREGAVQARGGSGSRTLRLIVVGEVAAAVALLAVAGLLIRSFAALLAFDPGFDPRHVLTVQVQLPLAVGAQPPMPASMNALGLIDDLGALPGVTAVSIADASDIPLDGATAIFYSVEGQPEPDEQTRPRAYVHRVTPGHFKTLGIRLVDGRDFTPVEMGTASTAVIVSEGVARRFWPGQSAVGRRIKRGSLAADLPWLTIVGVVAEANLRGIPRNPTADPDLYFPYSDRSRAFSLLMRTTGEPAALTGQVRALLQQRERGVAVFGARPLSDLVDSQLESARFLSWLLGVFAVMALTLALIGIYGLLAYWVRRRTQEIGIRAALGASRARLIGLVVGQGVGLTLAGIAVGGLLAAWGLRFAESQLFGVSAFDPMSFAGTCAVMLASATCASLLPALRALRVDPIVALRGD
jgi:predicted permease